MAANYYRLWVRFQKPETKRRLQALRHEMSKSTNKKLSASKLVESIVEQFLDANVLKKEAVEEKE
jgi:hypothetical protein